MSDWQPIESAPKDGTFILGYQTNDELCICKWLQQPVDQFCRPGWYCGDQLVDITQWQPEPAKPVPYYRDPARWELVDVGAPRKIKALLMPGSYHLDWQPTRLEFVIETLNEWHKETGARVDGLVEFFEAGLGKE